jgi:hypothetical protein
MLFTAVTHLVEVPKSSDITEVKDGKVSNLLSGYTETNSIHNRTTFNFILKNVNK